MKRLLKAVTVLACLLSAVSAFAQIPVVFTGNVETDSREIVSISSAHNLRVGEAISGAGIPSGTTITLVGSSLGAGIWISSLPTATATGVTLTAEETGYTSVTAAYIQDASGSPMASGRVTFFPVNNLGQGISAIAGGGGGMITQTGVTFLVVNGAITTDTNGNAPQVADTALTTPAHICYRIVVTNSAGAQIQGPGYALQQPTGASFDLDTAPPNEPMQATVQIGPQGPAGPAGSGSGNEAPITGLRYGNDTGADTVASSAQVQAAIGSSVYDPSGAAATAQSTAEAYALSHGGAVSSVTTTGAPGNASLASGVLNIPPPPVQLARAISAPVKNIAYAVTAADHFNFSDGTDGWYAGSPYHSYGDWMDNTGPMMLANPNYFSAAQVLNEITKFVNARDGTGRIPVAVNVDGTANSFCSAWDFYCYVASGDGIAMLPQLAYLHYQKTGSTAAYSLIVAPWKTAVALVPRNGSTHLMTIVSGHEYVCGEAFEEIMRDTGDVAQCNVWYAWNTQIMAYLAAQAGDSTNQTYFASEHTATLAGIAADSFVDATTGLLKAATGQNSTNLDVYATSLAVFCDSDPMVPCGVLTAAQKTAVSNYFVSNYSTLVDPSSGFVLNSPTDWSVVAIINSSGGESSSSYYSFVPGTNQDGFWPRHIGWFMYAEGLTSPTTVAAHIATYVAAADPTAEYYNKTAPTVNAGGTQNLVSPAGPNWIMDSAPYANAATCLLNVFGICNPGLTTTAAGPVLDWPMNEGSGTVLADAVSGNTATLDASVSWGTLGGVTGSVPTFSASQYATAANDAATNFDKSQPFSISAWFTLASVSNYDMIFSALNSGNTLGWYLLFDTSNEVVLRLSGTSGAIQVLDGRTYSTGTLYQVVATYDGSGTAAGVKLYRNGTASTSNIATDTLTGSILSGAVAHIGSDGAGGSPHSGALFGVRVYQRALTSTEVAAMYAAGTR